MYLLLHSPTYSFTPSFTHLFIYPSFTHLLIYPLLHPLTRFSTPLPFLHPPTSLSPHIPSFSYVTTYGPISFFFFFCCCFFAFCFGVLCFLHPTAQQTSWTPFWNAFLSVPVQLRLVETHAFRTTSPSWNSRYPYSFALLKLTLPVQLRLETDAYRITSPCWYSRYPMLSV